MRPGPSPRGSILECQPRRSHQPLESRQPRKSRPGAQEGSAGDRSLETRCDATPNPCLLRRSGQEWNPLAALPLSPPLSITSRHEADADVLIPFVHELARDRPDATAVDRFVREREERLRTEFHASHLQSAILPELVRLYPESRYILPIRDCYSWLESWINHELGRDPTLASWYDWRNLVFGEGGAGTPAEEKTLGEFGLRPLRAYLRYWSDHSAFVLNSVPSDRLLVIRTHEIRERVPEIAEFLGIRAWTLDRARSHQFQRSMRIPILSTLPDGYLDELVREHCQELMERFYPERCP